MNDEFLNPFYETPRPEFADALYKRISREPHPPLARPLATGLTFRNAAVGFVCLLFVAACVYAVTEKRWDKIGNMWLQVRRTETLDLRLPPDITPPAETSEEVEFLAPPCWSVEEAREMLRFDLQMPGWAPAGFTFDNQICGIDQVDGYVNLYWAGADKNSGINFTVNHLRGYNFATQEYEIGEGIIWNSVAPGSYEEIQVHGQPAVLVRGNWEEPFMAGFRINEMVAKKYEFKWDKNRGIQLYWVDGDVMYSLVTLADVSEKDVIQMAESLR